MKRIIAALLVILSVSAHAAYKCERDEVGGICCWDTEIDGDVKPIDCD